MNEPYPTWPEGLQLVGAALAYYLVLVCAAQLLRRTRGVQFGGIFHVFAFVAALTGGLALSDWIPSWHVTLLLDLGALTTLLATFPLVTLLNRALWSCVGTDGRIREAPRLLAETTGLIVFIALTLLVAQSFYSWTVPTSLWAGSGIIALVVGFAMQDLLGNIWAGFALYVSRPFKVGDWLLVDNQHARVLEVTWRSTRLVTDDDVLLEMPNSSLVKQPIHNFHQPAPEHALRITIGLHYNVPPARAQGVLRAAAASVPGVCTQPPPQINVLNFADSAITYEVKFWIQDHGQKSRLMSDVRSHCWYAVRRADMEIPFPIVTLYRATPRDTAGEARAAAATALRRSAIFNVLTPEQVNELVCHSPVVLFAQAEPLIEQGAEGGSMFLLVRGRVEVRVRREGATKVVTQLGPGDCLGEMSMLTGEKRSATVAASDEVEAVEITHEAFSAFIRHNPEVLTRLGDLLAKRQQANVQITPGDGAPSPMPETRDTIISRLRAFFELGS
ncbi:MAG TPA: mechanosensitive ion channel family protein [Opitutales bacterium]|nr:mechanosensitive ion channel family protein [Opitutales bacterium]